MNPTTHPFAARELGLRTFVAMIAATTLVVSGCASKTAQPIARGQPAESQIPYRLPAEAKIAVTHGRFSHPTGVVHGGPGSPYPKQAIISNESCVKNLSAPDMSGLGIWLVYLAIVGTKCAVDSISAAQEEKEERKDPKTLIILRDVPTADTSQAHKASDGKDDPAADSAQRRLSAKAFAAAIAHLRPLPDRVRSYARERGLGELDESPAPEAKSPQDTSEAPTVADYIIEVGVAGVEMRPTHFGELYWFGLIARGRLVRIKDQSVLQAFETEANTNPDAWRPEGVRQLSEELDFALNVLARRIVDDWLEPVLKGQR